MRRLVSVNSIANFLALTAGLWLAGCGTSLGDDEAAESIRSVNVDAEALEKLAGESCECVRGSDGSEKEQETCWQEYKAATAKMDTYGMASACAPISTEIECVASDGSEKCWIVERRVVGASQEIARPYLCSVDEARAVEQAYLDGWSGPNGKEPDPSNEREWAAANKRADAALDAMLNRILAGKGHPTAQGNGDCAG